MHLPLLFWWKGDSVQSLRQINLMAIDLEEESEAEASGIRELLCTFLVPIRCRTIIKCIFAPLKSECDFFSVPNSSCH